MINKFYTVLLVSGVWRRKNRSNQLAYPHHTHAHCNCGWMNGKHVERAMSPMLFTDHSWVYISVGLCHSRISALEFHAIVSRWILFHRHIFTCVSGLWMAVLGISKTFHTIRCQFSAFRIRFQCGATQQITTFLCFTSIIVIASRLPFTKDPSPISQQSKRSAMPIVGWKPKCPGGIVVGLCISICKFTIN